MLRRIGMTTVRSILAVIAASVFCSGSFGAATAPIAPGQPPEGHILRRTPVINVGPRPMPAPTETGAAARITPRTRWRRPLGVVLFVVLLAAIVVLVAIAVRNGFVLSLASEPVRFGAWVLSATGWNT